MAQPNLESAVGCARWTEFVSLLESRARVSIPDRMDKAQLREIIVERLKSELELQTRAALMARDEATNEESKPENQYDMHSQEAAYLAEGQARIAADLLEAVSAYQGMPLPLFTGEQPISIGAIVTLEARDRKTLYFVGPRNGGMEIPWRETTLVVVTPQSPLGRQLLGKKLGEVVQLPGRGAPVPNRIAAIE
jgi:transcription elongation GreA/GreB family factor